jgi:hypothetical protein
MTNTWDDLPIEMMGERPEFFIKKERRDATENETHRQTPHPPQDN